MPGGEFRVGRHLVDVERDALRRDGVVVPLQAQPSRLLMLLVRRAGSVVTREEIRAHLWGDTVVAYDQSINHCIRQIRVALGDEAELVQTVPRRGYRIAGSAVRPVAAVPPVGAGRLVRARVAAFAVAASLACGFALGSANRVGSLRLRDFVSGHLAHPDRCPYLRVFVAALRNS